MKRIIDAHCHIYPNKLGPRAVESVDSFYGGLPTGHHDGTTGTLLSSGEKNGISHFIVHSVATRPEQVSRINAFLAESMKNSGGRFTALGTMHPLAADLTKDMDELQALGLKGVKIHPDIQQFRLDDEFIFPIFEMCEKRGLPVLVHTGDYRYDYSNPSRVVPVLKTFPKLKFIGAHFGGWSVWEEACRKLAGYENLWVDTCSSFYWLRPEKAREIIRAYGASRVMFGTDYPFWFQDWEIEYLKGLDLTEDELEDIFWRTCTKLFGISFEQEEDIDA
ncbi:MAG: amidohydrolase [Blautia sp.]|nr:amidohydrolase [Blautia sp.]